MVGISELEQGTGVEPALTAWEAAVIPIYQPCKGTDLNSIAQDRRFCKEISRPPFRFFRRRALPPGRLCEIHRTRFHDKKYTPAPFRMNRSAPEILIADRFCGRSIFMQGKVEICGVNTAKLKVLKNEETIELLKRTKKGDMEAREKLIAGNLRLVLSVIQKFTGRGENVDDLFQVGCIGLIKAIDNFNTDLDVRFSTYGVPMIVGEIRRYLRDNSAIRVSRSMRDTAYKVLQAKEAFLAEHQREPSVDEVARQLGVKREDVVFALDAIVDPVSLYEPVYSDSGDAICVIDQVKDSKNTDESWLEHIALKEAMDRLSERERHILNLRFFEGRTQMEVSAEVGISQAQVSRLEKNAIRQIRKNM